jgi:hypothetical protein
VAVEEDDLLEAVVGQRFGDVEHVMHEVLEVVVDRARKIHDVARVAVGDDRQHEQLVRDQLAGAGRDAARADEIDVQGQMRAVLLDGAARQQADLAHFDRVVDLGPGQFFVAILGRGSTRHVDLPRRFVHPEARFLADTGFRWWVSLLAQSSHHAPRVERSSRGA